MDRITRLLGTANRSQKIIELGAGYCPVAPKSGGWQTHVVDHAERDELRTKYAGAGVDTGLIEEVDTIWRGGPLHEAVPPILSGQVDLIIASHVLEHIPDLIGFFQSATRLVRPDGALSVALPDRRYCFDCLKPWTTTGDLLDAHHRDMNRHSLKTAFNHMAYSATIDGQLAWGPRPVGKPVLMDPFAAAVDTAALFRDQPDGPYRDYHAWQFTPAGFQLVMLELAALGVSDWRVERLDGPENFEFFAVLRRGGAEVSDPVNLQVRRQGLLLAQLAETREQIDFMLGTAGSPPEGRTDHYEELLVRLTDQDNRLREMSETLAWLRAVLRPARRVWRTLRGKN
ncbi:MAG: methyltransferase domain-containing protein [Rhodopila sp.]|nr:methyltransferase domain-containing protein [Rhodopila sp.]